MSDPAELSLSFFLTIVKLKIFKLFSCFSETQEKEDDNKGGGIALYIKKNLIFDIRSDLCNG